MQVSVRIIGTLLIANRALNGLEIKWRITVHSLPLAQTGIDAQARFIQSLDIVLVYVTAWFRVQFGINSTSEWLLIAQGEAECNYAIHECY